MARIEGVPAERAGLFKRFVYWMTRRKVGKVAEPVTIAAHHGPIFRGYLGYEYALTQSHRVDVKLKTLASLKAGALVGCPF
jgi:hypothetical protein